MRLLRIAGILVVGLYACQPAAASGPTLLLAWDGGAEDDFAYQAEGIHGRLHTSRLFLLDQDTASTSGLFGGIFPGASTEPGTYNVRMANEGQNNAVIVEIRNWTGTAIRLHDLFFEYGRWWDNSPQEVTVYYSHGNLHVPEGTTIAHFSDLPVLNDRTTNYPHYKAPLSNLATSILPAGGQATFVLEVSNAGTSNTSGAFDNIAFTGEVLVAPTLLLIDSEADRYQVHPMSIGAGLVFPWEPDTLYADGNMARMMRDIGIGSLRWPGGTVVTHYHWNDMIGHGWIDSWDPEYDRANDRPPEEFMGIDDYLALIDQTGAEIMLGVNMSSGRRWDREPEGIEEARSLMQYVKDRGYDVRYIYLDNESYHSGNNYNKGPSEWTATTYGEAFTNYAAAIRTIFPNAKLIANWRNDVHTSSFKNRISEMFNVAGHEIDLVDIHWYWQWDTASWEIWKSQDPMQMTAYVQSSGLSYAQAVEKTRQVFAEVGHPDIDIVVLEWNIGPGPWREDPAHTPFRTALMQSEMQMQFMQAGVEIGLLWTTQNPRTDATTHRSVFHPDGRPSPTALWMWMYSQAIGMEVVDTHLFNGEMMNVLTVKGPQDELLIYMLNKRSLPVTLTLETMDYGIETVDMALHMAEGASGQAVLAPTETSWDGTHFQAHLPADSLTLLAFNRTILDTDGDGIPDDWEIRYFGGPTNAVAFARTASGSHTLYEAYRAGIHPHDPMDGLELQKQAFEGGKDFSWFGRPGRRYRLLQRTNLVEGFWQPVTEWQIGHPGENRVFIETANDSQRFYALEVGP